MHLRFFRRSLLSAAVLAGTLIASGCGSSNTTTATGSIGLSLSPSAATVQIGGATVVTGTLIRTDFTGDVTISVSGLPTGVTGTVTTAPVNGGNTAIVSIAANSAAAVGVDTLVVHASATGFSDATAPFILTIAPASANGYTFTVGTPTLTAAPGGTAITGLAFTRNNFTGNVALSVDNLPTGVTASFNPSPATGAVDTLTLSIGGNAVPGTTTLTVRGTSAGLTDVVAPVSLTVSASAGGFTVAALPTQLALTVGGAPVTSTITATRSGGFAGAVTYTTTITGTPTGLAAAVAATATADVSTLTITPSAGLVAGTYNVVVHANASGQTERTVTVPVVVTAGGATSLRLDFSGCAASAKPILVAYQDGSGAWTKATGAADVYPITISSSTAAIAVVTQPSTTFTTAVTYLAQSEFSTYTGACTTTGSKAITATVAGLNSGDAAFLTLGGGSGSVFAPLTAASITNVANSGTFDLVGSKSQLSSTTGARILLRRGVNVGTTSSLGTVDFSGTESFAPATATITLAGVPVGETSLVRTVYATGSACSANVLFPTVVQSGSSVTVLGVPSANQVATDFHQLQVSATTSTTTPSSQSVLISQHALTTQTITLPAALTATSVTVAASSPYKRLQVTGTLPTEFTSDFFSYADAAGNVFQVSQSAGYLAGSHTLSVVAPDLSSVSGFLASWVPSGTVTWTVSGLQSNLGAAGFCSEGATVRSSIQTGTL